MKLIVTQLKFSCQWGGGLLQDGNSGFLPSRQALPSTIPVSSISYDPQMLNSFQDHNEVQRQYLIFLPGEWLSCLPAGPPVQHLCPWLGRRREELGCRPPALPGHPPTVQSCKQDPEQTLLDYELQLALLWHLLLSCPTPADPVFSWLWIWQWSGQFFPSILDRTAWYMGSFSCQVLALIVLFSKTSRPNGTEGVCITKGNKRSVCLLIVRSKIAKTENSSEYLTIIQTVRVRVIKTVYSPFLFAWFQPSGRIFSLVSGS